MVVTASTTNGDAHDRRTDGLYNFIHTICSGLPNCFGFTPYSRCGNMWSGNEKSCGFSRPQRIASDLFTDKLIVRFVIVKGADDVVPVNPRIFTIQICLRTVGFCPTDDVQPVLSPTFTKVWAIHQLIDQISVSLFRILIPGCQKTGCLLRGRHQSG